MPYPRPTPGRSAAGSAAMKVAAAVEGTWYAPSGFAFLVASRAMRRLGPDPTDATQPVRSSILLPGYLTPLHHFPISQLQPLTARYAPCNFSTSCNYL